MELVRLTTVRNEIEAEQVRSLLGFEGIESMQRPTDFGAGSVDGTAPMAAREILVLEKDLEVARTLLSTDTD